MRIKLASPYAGIARLEKNRRVRFPAPDLQLLWDDRGSSVWDNPTKEQGPDPWSNKDPYFPVLVTWGYSNP